MLSLALEVAMQARGTPLAGAYDSASLRLCENGHSMIRIANGQGFWGDWLEAPVRLVEQGPIDYLALDYLAEITMSILQKQKQADPTLGYARDFPPLIGRIVEANARAQRPRDRQRRRRESHRLRAKPCAVAPGLKVAVVLATMSSRASTNSSPKATRCAIWIPASRSARFASRILSANAYIGAFPLAEALATGARRRHRRPLRPTPP